MSVANDWPKLRVKVWHELGFQLSFICMKYSLLLEQFYVHYQQSIGIIIKRLFDFHDLSNLVTLYYIADEHLCAGVVLLSYLNFLLHAESISISSWDIYHGYMLFMHFWDFSSQTWKRFVATSYLIIYIWTRFIKARNCHLEIPIFKP